MNRRQTDSRQTSDRYHHAWNCGVPAYVNMTEMARKKVERMKGRIMDRLPTTYRQLTQEFRSIHPDLIAEALDQLENEKKIGFSGKTREWVPRSNYHKLQPRLSNLTKSEGEALKMILKGGGSIGG